MKQDILPFKTSVDSAPFREERIEKINDVPVISMERALRFLYRTQEFFPEWGPLHLPYSSRVEETCQQAYSNYVRIVRKCLGIDLTCKVDDLREDERERYYAYTLHGLPDMKLYSKPVPNVDDIRTIYPEGSYPRYLLEQELAITKIRVKEALQIVYNRAFGPFHHGENQEALSIFRKQFVRAMQKMDINYEPIRIVIAEAEDGEVVSVETIETGMNTDW